MTSEADEDRAAATALSELLTSAMTRAYDEKRTWLYSWEREGYRWLIRFLRRRPDGSMCAWSASFLRLNREAILSDSGRMDFNLRAARLDARRVIDASKQMTTENVSRYEESVTKLHELEDFVAAPLEPQPELWALAKQGAKMREGTTTDDYRAAISGEGEFGSLGYEWSDKPHRLVYDLCGEIEVLKASSRAFAAALQELCSYAAFSSNADFIAAAAKAQKLLEPHTPGWSGQDE